jgi:hypothetical protein
MYYSFYCNTTSGQVSFKAPNSTYRVTSIDPSTRTFSVQLKYLAYERSLAILLNELSNPFILRSEWFGNDSSEGKGGEAKISWEKPLAMEPSCTSSRDCKDLKNSTCNIASDGKKRCLCNGSFLWDASNLNCTKGQDAISCASCILRLFY